jgi:hypothetical protein
MNTTTTTPVPRKLLVHKRSTVKKLVNERFLWCCVAEALAIRKALDRASNQLGKENSKLAMSVVHKVATFNLFRIRAYPRLLLHSCQSAR